MRSEFEKNRYWIGLYRSDVDFDETLGEFGRYVANGSRKFDAANLESFNEKWEVYANAWQHQQSKVDELEHKAKLRESDHKALLVKYQATKKCWEDISKEKEELQRRNQMLNDNIKEQGQKLVYQNEVIETQAEKLLGLRNEKAELQKRVDAAFRVLSQLNALDDEAHKRWKREACMFSQGESNAYEHAVRLLEQALKGGGE